MKWLEQEIVQNVARTRKWGGLHSNPFRRVGASMWVREFSQIYKWSSMSPKVSSQLSSNFHWRLRLLLYILTLVLLCDLYICTYFWPICFICPDWTLRLIPSSQRVPHRKTTFGYNLAQTSLDLQGVPENMRHADFFT